MANPNPYKARMAANANRNARGDVDQLRAKLWRAIERLDEMLDDDEATRDDIRKTAHALSQIAGPFLKSLEVGELAERLAELEAAVTASAERKRAA